MVCQESEGSRNYRSSAKAVAHAIAIQALVNPKEVKIDSALATSSVNLSTLPTPSCRSTLHPHCTGAFSTRVSSSAGQCRGQELGLHENRGLHQSL